MRKAVWAFAVINSEHCGGAGAIVLLRVLFFLLLVSS